MSHRGQVAPVSHFQETRGFWLPYGQGPATSPRLETSSLFVRVELGAATDEERRLCFAGFDDPD